MILVACFILCAYVYILYTYTHIHIVHVYIYMYRSGSYEHSQTFSVWSSVLLSLFYFYLFFSFRRRRSISSDSFCCYYIIQATSCFWTIRVLAGDYTVWNGLGSIWKLFQLALTKARAILHIDLGEMFVKNITCY